MASMKMRMTVLAALMAVTPQMRATIHRAFRPDDFEVVWAMDTAEAVKASARQRPDLVLLDLNRPLDGAWGNFENLRAVNPDTPVILVAEPGATHDKRFTDRNVVVVEKPIGSATLKDSVNVLLKLSPDSLTPLFAKAGEAGGARVDAERVRASLFTRHDAPPALSPSYRHWGINE